MKLKLGTTIYALSDVDSASIIIDTVEYIGSEAFFGSSILTDDLTTLSGRTCYLLSDANKLWFTSAAQAKKHVLAYYKTNYTNKNRPYRLKFEETTFAYEQLGYSLIERTSY